MTQTNIYRRINIFYNRSILNISIFFWFLHPRAVPKSIMEIHSIVDIRGMESFISVLVQKRFLSRECHDHKKRACGSHARARRPPATRRLRLQDEHVGIGRVL